MKTIVEILECGDCGRNIIVLNKNLEGDMNKEDMTDMCCPICGDEFTSSMTREIEINHIK